MWTLYIYHTPYTHTAHNPLQAAYTHTTHTAHVCTHSLSFYPIIVSQAAPTFSSWLSSLRSPLLCIHQPSLASLSSLPISPLWLHLPLCFLLSTPDSHSPLHSPVLWSSPQCPTSNLSWPVLCLHGFSHLSHSLWLFWAISFFLPLKVYLGIMCHNTHALGKNAY